MEGTEIFPSLPRCPYVPSLKFLPEWYICHRRLTWVDVSLSPKVYIKILMGFVVLTHLSFMQGFSSLDSSLKKYTSSFSKCSIKFHLFIEQVIFQCDDPCRSLPWLPHSTEILNDLMLLLLTPINYFQKYPGLVGKVQTQCIIAYIQDIY